MKNKHFDFPRRKTVLESNFKSKEEKVQKTTKVMKKS